MSLLWTRAASAAVLELPSQGDDELVLSAGFRGASMRSRPMGGSAFLKKERWQLVLPHSECHLCQDGAWHTHLRTLRVEMLSLLRNGMHVFSTEWTWCSSWAFIVCRHGWEAHYSVSLFLILSSPLTFHSHFLSSLTCCVAFRSFTLTRSFIISCLYGNEPGVIKSGHVQIRDINKWKQLQHS